MKISHLFQLAGMFLIPLFMVLIPLFLGKYYGIYSIKKSPTILNAPIGTAVGAAFGLLAFMLAFTFQIVANRYDSRKELLLEEVTNIRTTYLRAGLIPEPFRSDTKKLITEYVDLRLEVADDYSKLDHMISRSQQILDTFWDYTEQLAEQDRSSEVYALYITSVNDLVDNYNQRVSMTLEYRIPVAIIVVLFIIEVLSMFALGYNFGISGKGTYSINLILAIVFAVVMFLILALDRPETGLVKLNTKPLITLQNQLRSM
ncbi:MAG TPA: hypothetical protein PKI34_12445 [Bacteroidales bacterium]|nr:hypothetical protein [Bacteroidales bacterium]